MNKETDGHVSMAEREIVATRVFDAPREFVWQVWTVAKHIAHWWGPNGFTNTIETLQVRPGGVWRFVMHGPDGTDYRNEIVYVEVRKAERLVYDHVSGPKFRATVTFSEQRGRTRVSMRMLFETAEERNKTVEVFNAIEGLDQTFGKLGAYLAAEAGAEGE